LGKSLIQKKRKDSGSHAHGGKKGGDKVTTALKPEKYEGVSRVLQGKSFRRKTRNGISDSKRKTKGQGDNSTYKNS